MLFRHRQYEHCISHYNESIFVLVTKLYPKATLVSSNTSMAKVGPRLELLVSHLLLDMNVVRIEGKLIAGLEDGNRFIYCVLHSAIIMKWL